MKTGNDRLNYGFIAQEVEESLAGREVNMIRRDRDAEKTYLFRITDLISPLVKAVQEVWLAFEATQAGQEEMKTLINLQREDIDALKRAQAEKDETIKKLQAQIDALAAIQKTAMAYEESVKH